LNPGRLEDRRKYSSSSKTVKDHKKKCNIVWTFRCSLGIKQMWNKVKKKKQGNKNLEFPS
jgi:hypothetical protein